MNDMQKRYEAFMESICTKYKCEDALPALREGFGALCEADDGLLGQAGDIGNNSAGMPVGSLDPERSTIGELLDFLKYAEQNANYGRPDVLDAQAKYLDDYAAGFVAELVNGAVEMSRSLASK